ncbi:MAG: hypothetical protein IKP00_03405, partial [Victivallales bacterium]|nr:hypothetical protein [Victivallales bacterium]
MQNAPVLLTVADGGIQTVPMEDSTASPQIVYLDFDGAVTSYVNTDLGVAIGSITVEPSGFGENATAAIAATLNGIFDDVVFTTEIPTDGTFSTVYVGVTSAFDEYGEFLGLAETIDSGNQIRDDNAFVLLDSSAPAELVVSVIAHETEHIVHGMEHSGEGLDRFAAIDVGSGQTSFMANVTNDTMDVHNGGMAASPQIYNGGVMNVYDGGLVGLGAVALNGVVNVYNNGGVGGMVAGSGGVINVYNNGTVGSSVLIEAGVMNVYDGGVASKMTVSRSSDDKGVGGVMSVYNGGVASDTTVTSGGRMWCYGGGVASTTTVNSGGSMMCLYDGCVASNTTVNSGGTMWCYDGGVASTTTVNSGFFHVYCLANSTTVNSGGKMWCYGGGVASNTTVNNGIFEVGGVANNTTVNNGGLVELYLGGTHSGSLLIAEGGVVSAYSDATIDFTVAEQKNRNIPLVNHYDYIHFDEGSPSFTITVTGGEEYGRYALAGFASAFNSTVTVKTTTGKQMGSLTVNGDAFDYDAKTYSLAKDGYTLVLDIKADITPPEAPVATADTTASTNQDVTVTATFSDDSAKKQYSLDNNEWLDYEHGIVMGDNGTVWFRSMDEAGNVSEVESYEVTNIDKEPPAEPAFRLSGDSASREVILSARWDTDDARCFYALEGEAMEEYKDPLRFSEDTRVHFQTRDAAGNETDRRLELMLAGSPTGVWGGNYFAYNCTVAGVELEPLEGRNIIGKVCHGSNDTILLLTDDDNGDAFFLDDIYSAAPDIATKARLSQVNQIIAGAGDDIIDLTSVRFDYANNGISVQGGDGNDVIWANNDDNWLFGDAGDDRIIGGNDVDVIVGGAGNDILHGGGGNDIFCFGGSWGNDTVEQLEGGIAWLWFDGVEREELHFKVDDETGNAILYCDSGSIKLGGTKYDNESDKKALEEAFNK